MAFVSNYSDRLWNAIYRADIPDQLSLDPEYIRIFGVHITGDRQSDETLKTMFTTVMITPIQMIDYFEKGLEIRIHNREDMIKIHKDIELYLNEWREHIKYDINLNIEEHKTLILSLEKFSKTIYTKAKNVEIIDNLFTKKKIGLVNPLEALTERTKPTARPDYEGISKLVRSKTTKPLGRF